MIDDGGIGHARASAMSLAPFVPRLAADWYRHDPETAWRRYAGTLVSADISGFTNLSERLARLGNEGAEELTDLINECFGAMIGVAEAHGGDVLKFGGDALLVLFTGANHAERACGAALGMRATLARPLSTHSVPHVGLKMSQGVHSGEFDLFLVDAGHRELLVTGPGVTATVECEAEAAAGEILLSPEAADRVPASWLHPRRERGQALLRRIVYLNDVVDLTTAADIDLAGFISPLQRVQIEAGVAGEHRRVTTAFVKFSHVDGLLATDGPAEIGRRLGHLATSVRVAADRYGVHWLASDVYADGGKVILTAGAPVSAGQDEDRMLRAVRAIVDADPGLHLRAGVNAGWVFAGVAGARSRAVYTVMGDAVNLAARLMQRAEEGEVIATQDTLAHAVTAFRLEPITPFQVKGKTAPIEAACVGAPLDDAVSSAPSTDELPFVGRDTEVQLLVGAAAAAARGASVAVDLVGEVGMGKSRLLDEFRRRLGSIDSLRVRGGMYSRATPYFALRGPLRQLLGIANEAPDDVAGIALAAVVERACPELRPWVPLLALPVDAAVETTPAVEELAPAFRRARLHRAAVDLLAAFVDGPLVVVVDDAHFLDEASAELLRDVIAAGRTSGQLTVISREPDPANAGQPLAAATPRMTRVELTPLDPAPSRQLLLSAAGRALLPDVVDRLVDHAGGLPLFVIELARMSTEGGHSLPDSIESLVTARIDTLPPAARVLLREISVLGAEVDLALATDAFDIDPTRAEDMWRSLGDFTVDAGAGRLRFRHPVYRSVAYEGLPFRRRRDIHRRIGHALESRGTESDMVSLLSLHFHRAQAGAEAWRYSVAAGEQARSRYANVAAAEFYRRALDAPRWDPSLAGLQVRDVWIALGDVSEVSARYDDAAAAYRAARALTRDDPPREVELAKKRGTVAERRGRYPEALRWYSRGINRTAAMDGSERTAALCDLELAYAGVRYRQGRWRDCVHWARLAAAEAEHIADASAQAHAWYLLDISLSSLGLPEAAHYRGRSLPVFEQLGDLVGQANALNNDGVSAYYEGRWREAIDFYERSRLARDRVGDVVGSATQANNIGELLSDQGRLDEARSLFGEAQRTWSAARYPIGVAVATGNLGRVETRAGNYDLALDLLSDAREQFARLGATAFAVEAEVRIFERHVFAGDVDKASVAADAVRVRLQRGEGDEILWAAFDRLEGWLMAMTGRPDDAERCLGASLDRAQALGATYEAAMTRLALALLRESHDPPATGLWPRVRTAFEALGVIEARYPGGVEHGG